MRIVVDTNVLVSGVLTPAGPPARVLDGLLARRHSALFDDRILEKYVAVLTRAKFGFNALDVGQVLAFLRATGELWAAPTCEWRTTDPGDQPFLDVAVAAAADALITGNRRHYPRATPVTVRTPREFEP